MLVAMGGLCSGTKDINLSLSHQKHDHVLLKRVGARLIMKVYRIVRSAPGVSCSKFFKPYDQARDSLVFFTEDKNEKCFTDLLGKRSRACWIVE